MPTIDMYTGTMKYSVCTLHLHPQGEKIAADLIGEAPWTLREFHSSQGPV